jgi:hypothetical protein
MSVGETETVRMALESFKSLCEEHRHGGLGNSLALAENALRCLERVENWEQVRFTERMMADLDKFVESAIEEIHECSLLPNLSALTLEDVVTRVLRRPERAVPGGEWAFGDEGYRDGAVGQEEAKKC